MKLTNELLREYLDVTAEIKNLETRKEELRAAILEQHGEFKSRLFAVSVSDATRQQIESLAAIRDKSQRLYDALFEAGCVYDVKSKRVTVKPLTK